MNQKINSKLIFLLEYFKKFFSKNYEDLNKKTLILLEDIKRDYLEELFFKTFLKSKKDKVIEETIENIKRSLSISIEWWLEVDDIIYRFKNYLISIYRDENLDILTKKNDVIFQLYLHYDRFKEGLLKKYKNFKKLIEHGRLIFYETMKDIFGMPGKKLNRSLKELGEGNILLSYFKDLEGYENIIIDEVYFPSDFIHITVSFKIPRGAFKIVSLDEAYSKNEIKKYIDSILSDKEEFENFLKTFKYDNIKLVKSDINRFMWIFANFLMNEKNCRFEKSFKT